MRKSLTDQQITEGKTRQGESSERSVREILFIFQSPNLQTVNTALVLLGEEG